MTKMMKRMINSYAKGVSKSMDANNNIKVVAVRKRATVKSAWESVGVELFASINEYEKKKQSHLNG